MPPPCSEDSVLGAYVRRAAATARPSTVRSGIQTGPAGSQSRSPAGRAGSPLPRHPFPAANSPAVRCLGRSAASATCLPTVRVCRFNLGLDAYGDELHLENELGVLGNASLGQPFAAVRPLWLWAEKKTRKRRV